jgi:acyl-coenzyme A synthetase/AMP-(fatty) acid ligase
MTPICMLQPYLMSPRDTAPAIIKMLKETACHKILTTQETLKPLISGIKQTLDAEKDPYHLDIIEMPPLFTIFPQMGRETSEDSFEEYPKVSSRPGLDQTLLYLHSSGSTGLPKSIKQSFLTMCNWAAMRMSLYFLHTESVLKCQ